MEYKLATKQQASALFDRFYPAKHVTPESFTPSSSSEEKSTPEEQKIAALARLNEEFTASVPDHEFSTAELQGYLLSCKMMPEKGARGVKQWVEDERTQKLEKDMRIEAKKRKRVEQAEKMEVEKFQKTFAKMNGGGSGIPDMIPPSTVAGRMVNGGLGFVTPPPPPPPTVGKQVNGMSGDPTETELNGAFESKELGQ